jgi:putative ABC transport system permease protein
VAESAYLLTEKGSNNTGFDWQGKTPGQRDDFGTIRISYEYGKTVGWQFIAGRDFSRDLASDSSGIIVNEAAVALMGLAHPVGEWVESRHWNKGRFTILGVVKNMVMESPFEPARPTIFSLQGNKRWLIVRINPQKSFQEALPKVEALFKKIAPAVPFEYKFVDEQYERKFWVEEQVGNLVSFFSGLAIFISCLGLFGLATFMAGRRRKEIGVRKVLGASWADISLLLSKDFMRLIVLSFVIASPLSSFVMHRWLEEYTYRINIGVGVFLMAGTGTLLITLLTVSFQTIKAALVNPVETLRSQ